MSSPAAPRRRNAALVVLDILVSIAVLAFALIFGLVMFQFVGQLYQFAATCSSDPALECNQGLLSVATYGLLGVTIVVFFLGVGFTVVRLIQRRYTWPWSLGAAVVMYVAFLVASWLTGMAVPA